VLNGKLADFVLNIAILLSLRILFSRNIPYSLVLTSKCRLLSVGMAQALKERNTIAVAYKSRTKQFKA
jgi:hypothetical protein